VEEYEVDLREYVRILWWGKWIILGVFAVAIGLAALLTVGSPKRYRAEGLVTVERPVGLPSGYTLPTVDLLVERVRDPKLLDQAAQGTSFTGQWLAESLQAKRQDSFVHLSLQGPVPPQDLGRRLGRVVAALQEETRVGLEESVTRRLAEIQSQRKATLAELAGWDAELARQRATAEIARDQLRSAIAEIRADPGKLRLSVGADATIQGYLVQKELDVLYARLQAVELALDEMERLGPTYVMGAGQPVTLTNQLAELAKEEASLRAVLPALPDPVVVVRGPTASGPLGASLKMNLAVAGVLGLFVGVLLAFLVHWLRTTPSESSRRASTDPPAGSPGQPERQ